MLDDEDGCFSVLLVTGDGGLDYFFYSGKACVMVAIVRLGSSGRLAMQNALFGRAKRGVSVLRM